MADESIAPLEPDHNPPIDFLRKRYDFLLRDAAARDKPQTKDERL
jgi:hypothetical protein